MFLFSTEKRVAERRVVPSVEVQLPKTVCRVANMSDLSNRSRRVACPRCKAMMEEVVRIAPVVRESGLIAYECPSCHYMTRVLWQPKEPDSDRE
jgi:transposase-like protein